MIEIGKKYRTRNGHEVTIFKTDARGEWPAVGLIHTSCDDLLCKWSAGGEFSRSGDESCNDLIEVKPRIKRTVWMNVYPNEYLQNFVYKSKHDADEYARPSRLACVKVEIDCEEGEGLQC